ncbi:Histidine--tRNA ligase [uncultured Gammaproteobacteria bacterium]
MISPRTPPGVMELLPRQQIAFQRLLDTIRQGYERFGFVPIETPVFETVEVLLTKSGGETEKQVYFAQSTGSRQQGYEPDLALRFDLTVPLARYVAEHERDLAFPFRRYQIQRVYRGERAQKGRYREFYQCDIDVIGKDRLSLHYDAEMPAVIHHVFSALNLGGFTINLSNRKILLGVLDALGVADSERQGGVLREIDKLDKTSRDKVLAQLTGPELELSPEAATRVLDLIQVTGSNDEILAHLRGLGFESPQFVQGVDELAQVAAGLTALAVPERNWRINLAIARGLDYYTGTVYETFLDDHPGLGSVCSGGRYDNLASHYTKSLLPGVGLSIGATRLFSQLLDAKLIDDGSGLTQVLVTQMDPALRADCFAIATLLRQAGINTELQAEPAKLAKQIKYADKAGIPLVVLIGEAEKANGTVKIKQLASGEQVEVSLAELPAKVRQLVAG